MKRETVEYQTASESVTHSVYPGIELIYNDIHTSEFRLDRPDEDSIFEISHCREGRVEFSFGGGYCYLSDGDLAVVRGRDTGNIMRCPLSHYHGITVRINPALTPRCLSCFLDDVNVEPSALLDKYCRGQSCYIVRSKPEVSHIFSELYSVPEQIRRGYYKVKILELLLFLSATDLGADCASERSATPNQVRLATQIHDFLTGRLDDHITLDELSGIFHASGTLIKCSFKAVYGVSINSYIRTHKMHAAALMLRGSGATVLEIAGRFGYDNPSKFACAFRREYGVSPNEYRNMSDTQMNI